MRMLLSINKKCWISLFSVILLFGSFISYSYAEDQAITFDSGMASFYDANMPAGTSPRSICTQYRNSNQSRGTFMAYGEQGSATGEVSHLEVGYPDTAGSMFWERYNADFYDQSVSINDGEVHNICYRYNGSDLSDFYVDGNTLASTDSTTLDSQLYGLATIGARGSIGSVQSDATFDNTFVYTVYKSDSELDSIFIDICDPISETNLVSFFRYDEDTDNILQDASPSGYDAELTGGWSLSTGFMSCGGGTGTTTPPLSATSTDALLGSLNFGIAIVIVLLFVIIIGYIFNSLNLKAKKKY